MKTAMKTGMKELKIVEGVSANSLNATKVMQCSCGTYVTLYDRLFSKCYLCEAVYNAEGVKQHV